MVNFKLGQIVKHKLNKSKLVIIKIFPKGIFRKQTMYLCSFGEDPRLIKDKENPNTDYLEYYESELNDAILGDSE